MPTSLDDLDVRVYVDYPQDRRNRLGPYLIACDGSHFDDSTANGCIIDPVTQSVLGMPLPMTPEWRTTTTGNYLRYKKADYTFSSPATSTDWLDFDFRTAGDTYLISASSDTAKKSSSVKITGGLKKNQPLFLSYSKIDKQEQNNQYILKLFWQSNVEFPNYDVGLFFKSDGGVDLHRGYVIKETLITWTTGSTTVTGVGTKFNTAISSGGDGLQANSKLYTVDGQLIGTVSSIASDTSLTLTSNPKFAGTLLNWFPTKTTSDKMLMVKNYSRTEQNFNANRTLKPLENPNGKFNDVFIIPCRGKDLLVFSSYGLNFCHSFEDLDDPYLPPQIYTNDKFSPVILPKCDFGLVIPTGNVAFQLAKLNFKAEWSISSKPIEIDGSYLQNSQLPFFTNVGDATYTWVDGFFGINYPTNKIKKKSGSNFNTSWPTNSRIYLHNYYDDNNETYSSLLGTISSVTTSEITLNSNSNYYTNYFNHLVNTSQEPSLSINYKKTGTITWNTSTKTITGTSTLFNTETAIGNWIYDDNDRLIGQVKSITSNTSLELYDNPSFSSVSSSIYWTNLPLVKFTSGKFSFEQTGPSDQTGQSFALAWSFKDKYGKDYQSLTNINTNKEVIFTIQSLSSIGNQDNTDVFYSFDNFYILNPETLNNTQIDITSAIEKLSLSRNQDGSIVGSLSARKKTLSDLSVVKPDILSNRSIKIVLKPRTAGYSETTIVEGFLSEPDIEYIQGTNYDNYALLNFEITDKKQQINEMFFSNAPSFEDQLVSYIIGRSSDLAAINGKDYLGIYNHTYIDPKIYTFAFDFNRMNASGQYNSTTTPNLGDSIGSFLENLRTELFSNYTLSIKNKWVFDYYRINWINLPIINLTYNYTNKTNSDLTLYLNETSANTYGSIPIHKGYKRTVRSLSRTYQRPDANKVTVIGIDKSNNNRITVTKSNTNSINPYIAAANRGDDWLGDTRDFVQISPSLSSLKSIEFAADNYYERLSKGREVIQFSSDFLTYFDNTTKAPNPEYWKTGTIYYNTSTSTVTGTKVTRFTEQLSNNDKIYANGTTLIGTVSSITDDDTFVLTANSAASGETVKWTNKILTGTITSLTNSSTVNGIGTSFTTELAVDDFIYHPTTGELIGKVFFITNNTSLVLYTDAYVAVSGSLFTKTKPYFYLEQFKFIDNSDVITLKDTSNATIGNYIVNSWNCEFVKDYTSATSDEIIVRNCVYQCQKTNLIENVPVYSVSEENEDYENVNNFIVGQASKIYLQFYCEKGLTASLISPPSGMTITEVNYRIHENDNFYVFEISWTPSSTQQNYVHTVELQLTPTGQSAVSFFYKFRVFSS